MSELLKVVSGYRFMTGIMKAGEPVRSWVLLLIAVNMSALFFMQHLEARVVLGAFMLGGIFMITMEYKMGLVRLMGLGHSLWLIMLPWLYFRLDQLPQDGFFKFWIMIVIAINVISLVIDIVDVIRYLRGDREPLKS